MNTSKNILLGVLSIGFLVTGVAQEIDSIPANKLGLDIIKAKEIPADTTAMDMEGAEQMESMEAVDDIQDNPLVLIKGQKKYDLKDYPEVAKFDSLWMKELYDSSSLFDSIYQDITALEIDSVYRFNVDTDTLKARLEILNQKTPFNIVYNPSLENVIRYFLTRKRDMMSRMLTISQFYFPLFEQELDNQNVPLELKYLAIVESALNPRARSRVGATGLWQFMYSTGKMYDLDVSSYVDERSDPINSTKAASMYLKKLHGIFNDWDLALAAYNSGPGNVNKAIRRSGGYKNYWNIRRNLPRETAGYVPAFLATMYIFEYAEEHGFTTQVAERPYFETDTVHVKSTITFNQISELVDVSEEELQFLNPAYKLKVIPYVKNKNYALRLPVDALGKFVANEAAIYAHVENQLESKEEPLPQIVQSQDQIRYKVRSGDFLGKIAERYGVGVSQIKSWNGLRSNNLRIGQRLTIYPRKIPSTTTSTKTSTTSTNSVAAAGTKVHTVKSGDSLWTISKKYPGISIDNLRKWNGISGNDIKPGTKLKLCDCSS
ncbi:LysM peptidoglycan-binding domain-containing protein [Arenibacter sp. TNZ]|jgi:membrane-bound lytic murein transglycosylase D|uniref:lytic transglycosylase domain-containing protein n=1 Tax=Arenibacter TaxID=178469 RepID=UPI000CD46F97|nr:MULTISPECIES: lytic transglycosylase domain-containing protein [Arenibacter]MCM4172229.1 LysM peptidoglycan-binding domain-containing protein [Arenibacter sp. TNZ]